MFDLVPTALSALATDANNAADQVTSVTLTDEGCIEQWVLTAPEQACVKFSGKIKRLLDTTDTTEDFIIDLTETYTVQAFGGAIFGGIAPTYFTS